MKPKEHGEDLLPMAISILELDAPGGADTLVLSKRLAMDVINMCIEVDITDPRAIWGVHHAQYAKQMLESPSPVAESLWIQLFAFFKLVPMKSEDTDVYQQFKHDILTSYILRSLSITAPTDDQADDLVATITKPKLIKNISPKIKCAAFDALASFPPPELYPLIPLPVDFLTNVLVPEADSLVQVSPQVLESLSGGPSSLLTGLLFHEIDNMRRAVFKALATDMGVNRNALEAGGGGEGDAADKELGKARRILKDLGSEGREKWVLGKSAAAVRSGLAAASLFLPVSLLADDLKAASSSFDPSTTTLPRLTAYKDLVNGLRDLSISDHPLIRAEAVTVWIAFWMSRLRALVSVPVQDQPGENNKDPMTSVEWLFKNSLQELEKRLREAKQPVPCANVIFSLVGLVSAASSLSVPDASENVSRMISLLISEYGRKFAVSSSATADQNFNTSELQKSDEVQFAVCLGLSYLARLLFPTDEVSFGVIISQLQNELMFSVSDDSQSGFAAGYGATIVLHSLVLSPSPNVPLISQLTSLVSENLLDPTNISSTAFCGLAIGLSNCLRDLKEFADIESVAELNVDGVLNAIVDRFLLSVEEEEGKRMMKWNRVLCLC
ncbi:hypothetical protein BDR26DRAFT_207502 [Obelidium mucronatum]|nr:hypothetical protein BDR26DRAFT_207502 [Obelidium mucronatum]